MTYEFPLVFHSQGVPLAGRVFRNVESLYVRQRGVIAMGSWLTVKEQMASTYARKLANLGYTAFVFDFTGFGESSGDPRRAEIPARKIADIAAAVQFMRTLAFVDPDRIGCVAVCASAQYTLRALADGVPISVVRERRGVVSRSSVDCAVLRRGGRHRFAAWPGARSAGTVCTRTRGDDGSRIHGGRRSSRHALPAGLLRTSEPGCRSGMVERNGGDELDVLAVVRWPLCSLDCFDAFIVRPFGRLRVSRAREARARGGWWTQGASLG
jgi:hypothetical protein